MAQWTDPHLVLRVSRTANEDEVKRAYRRALLQYHPDKIGNAQPPPMYTIDDVNKAYVMLRAGNSESEVTLDSVVVNFNEVCDLGSFDERELSDGTMEWEKDCRCGEKGFRLTELELESNGDADEIAVQCTNCSLWTLVQYAVE